MKKTSFILSIVALAGVIAMAIIMLTTQNKCGKPSAEGEDGAIEKGAIVYFNLDRVLAEYDMANDLRQEVGSQVESINQEVNRRGSKLEKDIKAFQEKINKGLLVSSVAQQQQEKLQQQQNDFQNYAAQKQQEINEAQAVMMNQLADAIKTFIDSFNEDMGYALIIATQGDNLPTPVVGGDPSLDITDDILEGLNKAYVEIKK